MRLFLSLRYKLIIIYILTILLPSITIFLIMPYYYNKLFTEQTMMLSDGAMTLITRNVEMYLDDLERLTITPYLNEGVMAALKLKASNGYDNASEYSKLEAEKVIRQDLPRQLRNTRQDILSTILLPTDGSVYVNTSVERSTAVADFPFEEQDWYKKTMSLDGKVAYISSHPQNYLQHDSERVVFSVARLIKDPDSGKPLGIIMTDAAHVIFEKIVSEAKFNIKTIIAILDEHSNPLYTNKPLSEDMRSQIALGNETINGETDTYRILIQEMPKSGWSVAVLFSNKEFKSNVNWIYILGAIFAAGGILVTFLMNVSLSHWIVKPFREMVHVMKRVQRGDLEQRFQIRGRDEVAQLGVTLNTMIRQLKELIDREYRAVLDQRNAEYRALQSQINPHFLYNTLNGFIGLNRSGEREMLERAILMLSNMLRYTLEYGDMTTLEDEFLFLQQYCELQKLRFEERLQIDLTYDPTVMHMNFPKLLLQPLVENAIIHGVEPLMREGVLTVRADVLQENGKWLRIKIEDNGAGFDSAKYNEGVGVTNTRDRLAHFNSMAKFKLDSTIGMGTKVEILIPFVEVEEG